MQYITHYQSPLGGITISSDGTALTGLWFDGQKYFASTLGADYKTKDLPVFTEAKRWLDIYFSGREPDFTPPLALNGSAFRMAVWQILQSIPYGQTITYGCRADRQSQNVSAGSWRCCRAQPHQYYRTLPQSYRRRRQFNRLCRRH